MIDFDNPANNDFSVVRQLTIHGPSEYGEHPDWLRDGGLAQRCVAPLAFVVLGGRGAPTGLAVHESPRSAR